MQFLTRASKKQFACHLKKKTDVNYSMYNRQLQYKMSPVLLIDFSFLLLLYVKQL